MAVSAQFMSCLPAAVSGWFSSPLVINAERAADIAGLRAFWCGYYGIGVLCNVINSEGVARIHFAFGCAA